ncbi:MULTISPECIES: Na+/H+ antiporter subunit E [Pseudomonadaceae]|jgi:multicomponent K+:H+ antiporter subunit E|uniref:Na+/H+ antiporter subunit E n=1 Tax=Stutzerimonas stutzeri TaxID=316 RepID=A0A172WSP1_STUST|nr:MULTISPECIES: Na+/H+ antiporter subunit E [Pseudomonadaceae]AZZ44632.1 Na+/H+ antiporter subunit E [Pseudomonadaceae bacterium SI-3]MAL37764.1 Na+/H+ antiporter subunit E [Pseudomonas sp.]MBU0950566.1 Na+/H+ antiporter subunit E [Gammaproteobacteria bacterium]BAP80523.1 multisubunit Na+/H+ antiporter MnhE subunit [Pseudomonas sp. MT-1]ANF26470.1 Na+/H+ antiporter subunit E [Stutzerimonas stutzeri]|tara:strand:- start:159 stop:659 length:501 start_codon:yes stop_codon:yes gene_type:complete
MKSRLLPNPALTLLLTLLWLLLNNALSVGQLVLGLFLGWAIPLLVQGFLVDLPKVRRPLKLCLFLLKVFYDIVVANVSVAKLVLSSRDRLQPAFVEIPMAIEHPFVLAVLTSIISLTPGTVSASLRPGHKMLLIHALDAPDTEALVAEVKSRYETPLLEIFECSRM